MIKIRNATEHHPEVQAISRFFCLYQFGPFEISPLSINVFVLKFFDVGGPDFFSLKKGMVAWKGLIVDYWLIWLCQITTCRITNCCPSVSVDSYRPKFLGNWPQVNSAYAVGLHHHCCQCWHHCLLCATLFIT